MQHFRATNVVEAVNTIARLMQYELDEEAQALHDSQKYQLSPFYKDWFAPGFRNWSPERKERHIHNFQRAPPSVESTFVKPLTAGRKPGHLPRTRLPEPSHVVERHEPPSMTMPSFVVTSASTTTALAI